MTKKRQFLTSIPFRLKLFSRDLEWLSEILYDTMALSSKKAIGAWKTFGEVNNNFSIKAEQAEESYFSLVKYTLHFNYIALHSLYTTAYSVFENFILDFGSKIEELSESKIKIIDVDPRGRGIDPVIKYLHKVHNFKNTSSGNAQWDDLVKFQLVRNLIIHNRNRLKNKKSDNGHLKPFLQKFDAHITKSGEFQIRKMEFMTSFKNTAIMFADSLASDCIKLFKEKSS